MEVLYRTRVVFRRSHRSGEAYGSARATAGKDPVAKASVAIPSGDVGEVWRKLRYLGRWSERKLELEAASLFVSIIPCAAICLPR